MPTITELNQAKLPKRIPGTRPDIQFHTTLTSATSTPDTAFGRLTRKPGYRGFLVTQTDTPKPKANPVSFSGLKTNGFDAHTASRIVRQAGLPNDGLPETVEKKPKLKEMPELTLQQELDLIGIGVQLGTRLGLPYEVRETWKEMLRANPSRIEEIKFKLSQEKNIGYP